MMAGGVNVVEDVNQGLTLFALFSGSVENRTASSPSHVQGAAPGVTDMHDIPDGWFLPPHRAKSSPVKLLAAWILLLSPVACSATDPTPSPRFDGKYTGSRESDRTEACGITKLHGVTSARVANGQLTMPLFSPKTPMNGAVGEDGTVRASGIWSNPTGGFPGVTVLNGHIADGTLDATATDFRCHTDLHLKKIEAHPQRPLSLSQRRTISPLPTTIDPHNR